MDKTSLIGLALGLIAVFVGMVMKGVELVALMNPAAILIILLGTAAAVIIAFPTSTIKKVPSYFKIIFTEEKEVELPELIDEFTSWAEQTRKEGLLSLENQLKDTEDEFLAFGLQLAVDGQTPEFIEDVMLERISAMEKRHAEGAQVFSQAGTYAPTLGVLGAVIGLIAALSNMEDMEVLGAAISAAFIATLLGIFTGYVLWHPFANKLRQKSKKEVEVKEIMIEGVLSIINGDSPTVVREKLNSYLPTKKIQEARQVSDDE
ncbi:flagellar motor stator protein MotA [Oceanobacillus sp. CAU 1775]